MSQVNETQRTGSQLKDGGNPEDGEE